MSDIEVVRCKNHLGLHIARTRGAENARKCGYTMASGGYDYCHACASALGACMLCGEPTVVAEKKDKNSSS
jgi:hypothetical protein